MARYSKQTLNFLKEVGEDRQKILAPIPTSADRMVPGNILIFNYTPLEGTDTSEQRIVLVVKCKRGDGVFPGKTGKLVSCIKLEGSSGTVVDTIIENLYKKRRRASYYGVIKESLGKLLGPNSFRTYKLEGMSDIDKLSLGTQKVRFD